jgi:hypothetical protein
VSWENVQVESRNLGCWFGVLFDFELRLWMAGRFFSPGMDSSEVRYFGAVPSESFCCDFRWIREEFSHW